MNTSETRTVTVTTTATSIRKTPLTSVFSNTFTAPANVGATSLITVSSTYDWVTGLQCTLQLAPSAGAVMPTGLAQNTQYWVIVVSGTTVRFATSYANALAGNAQSVNSGSGTGVVTILPAAYDVAAAPIEFSTLYYASGGGSIQLVDNPNAAYGTGLDVPAGSNFNDIDQSNQRYAVASSGSVSLRVTDVIG